MRTALDNEKIKKFGAITLELWKWAMWGLRWVSVFVFCVLFFVGVYLQLPWKMLVCLAVIPIVGIFVPKKIQPWVWGALTIILLVVWIWVRLPESNDQRWRPFRFDSEIVEIRSNWLTEIRVNASSEYSKLFTEYDESIFYFNYPTEQAEVETFSAVWNPQDFPQVAERLDDFKPGIEIFLKATAMEGCRFAIPYDLEHLQQQQRQVNQLKGWSRLVLRSANRDLYLGNLDEALEKQLAVLSLAQHLYQQQTLFDQAAAFHIELMATRGLESLIINDVSKPDVLRQIEQAILNVDPHWVSNWAAIQQREKLLAKNIIGLFYEINEDGNIRMSHNVMLDLQEAMGYPPRRIFMNHNEMSKIAAVGLWLSLPKNPERIARLIDDRFDHYSLQVQKGVHLPTIRLKDIWKLGLNFRSVIDWLAMQRIGYFWAFDGQYRRHEALVSRIHIFTATKRHYLMHNVWPDSLDQLEIDDPHMLIDAINGRQFVYRKTGDSFQLYSLGPNGIDDDGQNVPEDDRDDIVFWPCDTTEDFIGEIGVEKTSE